jgi:hypothetical protein
MNRTTIVFAALLALGTSATAQVPRVVKPLESSYELDVSAVAFPETVDGAVKVTPCAGCARVSHRLTPTTAFFNDDQRISFEDFRALLDARRPTSRRTYVGVHYGIATSLVTRIRLKTE